MAGWFLLPPQRKERKEIMKNYIKVSVIDCNRDTFLYHYDEYVIGEERLPYGDSLFTVAATSEVYDEIKTLKEEGIEIVEEIVG